MIMFVYGIIYYILYILKKIWFIKILMEGLNKEYNLNSIKNIYI